MVHALSEGDRIYQALVDAGFDDGKAAHGRALIESGETGEVLEMLHVRRRSIVSDLHRCGRQIDCLDYLVSSIKQASR